MAWLSCFEITHERIIELRKARMLLEDIWDSAVVTNMFLEFQNENGFVGALELSNRFEGKFIEVIEVMSPKRRKGFGKQMIQMTQEVFTKIGCVAVSDSARLFEQCGFRKCSDSSIWIWKKVS